MTNKALWSPKKKINKLQEFQKNNISNTGKNSYNALHNWSIKNKKEHYENEKSEWLKGNPIQIN